MNILKRLWIVTYKKGNKVQKCKFYVYENGNSSRYFVLENDFNQIEVSKNEGNEIFKRILELDKNAKINKII